MNIPVPRFLKVTASGVLALVLAGAVFVAAREHRTFDAPVPDIRASRDPAVVARGRYLARGAAHCADCHGAPGSDDPGRPLSGGKEFHLPVGVFRVTNV